MREEDKKEQQRKEEEKNNVSNNYYPASPVSGHTYKQDPLLHYGTKEKQALGPNYYPPNYVPEEKDAPFLVDNLVTLTVKEEDQGEKEEKNNGEETNKEEEEDRKKDMDETQADAEQEAGTIICNSWSLILFIKNVKQFGQNSLRNS